MKSAINIFIIFLFGFVRDIKGHNDSTMYEARHRCDYKYGTHVMGWFKYHLLPATWHDALVICTAEGSMLASPATKEMKTEMIIQFVKKSRIFTGLHTTYSKGSYKTVDGIPLDTIPHKWEHKQPDNKNNSENCLAMNDMGFLSDVNCNDPLPFICFTNATAEITKCGTHDRSYLFDDRTKHCYKFHTIPRNFSRAYLVCSAEGGHLAILNSEDEAQILVDLFSNYPATTMIGPFWKEVALIGIGTWQEGGDWRTIHGETLREAGFEKWSPGEPNNYGGAEFCGSISRKGMLYDSSCVKEYAFICEKTPDYPPYCSTNTNKSELEKAVRMWFYARYSDIGKAEKAHQVWLADRHTQLNTTETLESQLLKVSLSDNELFMRKHYSKQYNHAGIAEREFQKWLKKNRLDLLASQLKQLNIQIN